MPTYRLKSAYLSTGWAHGVNVTVAQDGFITSIDTAVKNDAQAVDGIVVPGMPNAHSHAFQRTLSGNTEYRVTTQDSFWTWRQAMYMAANTIGPEELRIIAKQLYIEMLKAGYTSVAEFHYLHHLAGGAAYAGPNLLWDAVSEAASEAGIGLTFLPTLYQTSDFGGKPPKSEQSRFVFDSDAFVRVVEKHCRAHRNRPTDLVRTGVAFHSLRAVPIEILRDVTASLRDIDATMPVHIHVAEQVREVRACLRATGRRPIELLLDQALLTPQWCLIHATHATPAELDGIVATGATVCLSISTEANLGDGFFNAGHFMHAGGRLCIGSDSQSSVDPAEELRWLEYQQRLRKRRRGVLAAAGEPHVGTRLWCDTALHGAQALGQRIGQIAVGFRADWLVLDGTHPSMLGDIDCALDHLVFAGGDAAIRDVMVAGRWVVKDHHHADDEESRAAFAGLMRRQP